MKRIYLGIIASIVLLSTSACSEMAEDNKAAELDFTTDSSAIHSFFALIKTMDEEEARKMIVNSDDVQALIKTNEYFKSQTIRDFGEDPEAQYDGIYLEAIRTYQATLKQMDERYKLTPEIMAEARSLDYEVSQRGFNGLDMAAINLIFTANKKDYIMHMNAVRVNKQWKAVSFRGIKLKPWKQ